MQTIHLNIHFNIQLINLFNVIYKNFKMIHITYMIFILNFIFTVVFYAMRWTKHDHIYICFEEILN
jgi:multisubunit Na+/H+ antiporter MnhF subunit